MWLKSQATEIFYKISNWNCSHGRTLPVIPGSALLTLCWRETSAWIFWTRVELWSADSTVYFIFQQQIKLVNCFQLFKMKYNVSTLFLLFSLFQLGTSEIREKEPLVTQFFKVLHSLTPAGFKNGQSDFQELVAIKNEYLENYQHLEIKWSKS